MEGPPRPLGLILTDLSLMCYYDFHLRSRLRTGKNGRLGLSEAYYGKKVVGRPAAARLTVTRAPHGSWVYINAMASPAFRHLLLQPALRS